MKAVDWSSCTAGEWAASDLAKAISYKCFNGVVVFPELPYDIHLVFCEGELFIVIIHREQNGPGMSQRDDNVAFVFPLRVTEPFGETQSDFSNISVFEVGRPRRDGTNPLPT